MCTRSSGSTLSSECPARGTLARGFCSALGRTRFGKHEYSNTCFITAESSSASYIVHRHGIVSTACHRRIILQSTTSFVVLCGPGDQSRRIPTDSDPLPLPPWASSCGPHRRRARSWSLCTGRATPCHRCPRAPSTSSARTLYPCESLHRKVPAVIIVERSADHHVERELSQK